MKKSIAIVIMLIAGHTAVAQIGARVFRVFPLSEEPVLIENSTGVEVHVGAHLDKEDRIMWRLSYTYVPFRTGSDPKAVVITQTSGLNVTRYDGFQTQDRFVTSMLSTGLDWNFFKEYEYSIYAGIEAMAGRYRTIYEQYVPGVLERSVDDHFYAFGYRFRLGANLRVNNNVDAFIEGNSQHTRFEGRFWSHFIDAGVGVRYWFRR